MARVGRFADLSDIGQGHAAVDLREYAQHRRTIAFKATEGTGFHDPSFPGWWGRAGRLGLHRIAYLFAHFHGTGHADAEFFLRYVFSHGVRRFHDLPVIDLEVMDAPTATTVLDLHRCCHTLARHWRPGWVYCSSSFIVSLGTPELPPGWRWWIADYADQLWTPAGIPRRLVAAWQHTDGRIGKAPHQLAGLPPCDTSELFPVGAWQLRHGGRPRRHRRKRKHCG